MKLLLFYLALFINILYATLLMHSYLKISNLLKGLHRGALLISTAKKLKYKLESFSAVAGLSYPCMGSVSIHLDLAKA